MVQKQHARSSLIVFNVCLQVLNKIFHYFMYSLVGHRIFSVFDRLEQCSSTVFGSLLPPSRVFGDPDKLIGKIFLLQLQDFRFARTQRFFFRFRYRNQFLEDFLSFIYRLLQLLTVQVNLPVFIIRDLFTYLF